MFSSEYCEIFKNSFLCRTRTLSVAASESGMEKMFLFIFKISWYEWCWIKSHQKNVRVDYLASFIANFSRFFLFIYNKILIKLVTAVLQGSN